MASDRIFPYFRLLSLLIAGILFAAFRILFFYPDKTGTMFAWNISSHMTCYLIGAGYVGGAYFFSIVALFGARLRWHEVRLAIPPVTAFTITMAVITVLHWDKFNNDAFPGQLWDALYFSLPFLLPLVMLHHERQRGDPPSARAEVQVDPGLRRIYWLTGVVLLVYGIILFVFPKRIMPTWPWDLTVVTTMAIGGWLILPGVAGVLLPTDTRWSAWRTLIEAQAFSVAFILVGVYLARDEFRDIPYSYIFVLALSLILALTVSLRWRMQRVV